MFVSHQLFFAVLVMYEHVYEVSSLSNFRKLALRWAALGSVRQRWAVLGSYGIVMLMISLLRTFINLQRFT